MAPKRPRAPSKSSAQAENAADGTESAADDPQAKRKRIQIDTSPSEAAPPRSTPRRSARMNTEAAPPKEQPSPTQLRFGGDGEHREDSGGSAGGQEEPVYTHIKPYKTNWRPLIPTVVNASAFAVGKRKSLVPFGATFPTAEGAARAADRALVAMWGPTAAPSLLNFPLAALAPTERHQRYGRDLTTFLQSLVAEGEAARAAEKAERARAVPPPAHWAENERRRRRLQRIRAVLPVDEAQPCGLCPACRQPWLSQRCYRTATAMKIGYKARAAAERAVEAAGEVESEEEGEEGSRDDQDHRQHKGDKGWKQGQGVKQKSEAAPKAAAAADVWTWHDQPPKQGPAVRQARKTHTAHVESTRLRAEAEAAEEAAAEAAALAAALAAARPPGPARAAPPRDFIPPPPHPSLLRAASTAAALGASLALVSEDAPRWALPPPPPSATAALEEKPGNDDVDGGIGRQCPFCMGWHGTRATCPLVAEAYATAVPAAAVGPSCPHCACTEVPGCKRCIKGEIPNAVWFPPALSAPWMDRVAPGTAGVMAATRRLAGAAAADFNRPDVADTLGPGALLAMGLLAEQVAAAGLGSARAAPPPPPPPPPL